MKKESGEGQVTLKIPRPLYEQLKQVISDSGFHSVTEFAVYVLRDLVSHRAGAPVEPARGALERTAERGAVEPPGEDVPVEPLSPDEIEAIRKRLSSLGYL